MYKRLKWITQCAEVASFGLHHFDYLKANQSRYFIEVFSIHGPQWMGTFWGRGVIHLDPTTCYYLGTYANYWDPANRRIGFAHETSPYVPFIMGNDPIIPGEYLAQEEIDEFNSLEGKFGKENMIWFLWPEKMPSDFSIAFFSEPHGIGTEIKDALTKMTLFHKEWDIVQWLRQKYVLDERKLRFKICIEKRYPPPSREPQYKVKDPKGPSDFPGIPISEMDLPAPEVPAGTPIPIGKKRFRLTLTFTILKITTFNGYWLQASIEEVI